MFTVAFEKRAEKEFLKLDPQVRKLIATKFLDLQKGNFRGDKALLGKHKGKFRKRAGSYRIIYYKEGRLLLITSIRISRRREVY